MSKLITAVWNILKSVYSASWASWGIVLASTMMVMTWGRDGFEYVFGHIPGITTAAGQLTGNGSQVVRYIGLVDTFIPLHEAIGFAGAFIQLLVACTLIRIAKAWVPTVSG
ncbi:MAG: hypothetical protein WA817_12150 [Candidatus Acidiferrum sp.]